MIGDWRNQLSQMQPGRVQVADRRIRLGGNLQRMLNNMADVRLVRHNEDWKQERERAGRIEANMYAKKVETLGK